MPPHAMSEYRLLDTQHELCYMKRLLACSFNDLDEINWAHFVGGSRAQHGVDIVTQALPMPLER